MQPFARRERAIGGVQALCTGLLDAVIWTWYRQVNYITPLTEGLESFACGSHVIPVGLLAVLLVIGLGRDRLPRGLRWGAIALAVLSTAGAAWLACAPNAGRIVRLGTGAALSMASMLCLIIRWERLARCRNLPTLLVALMVSLLASYGFSYGLMVAPPVVYRILLAAAPLTLLADGGGEPWVDRAVSRPAWRSLLTGPAILCCCLGVAGGFIVATGGSTLASTPAELLVRPSPLYFLMLLLFLALGVVACNGLPVPRAVWFAILGLSWSVGSILGAPWAGALGPAMAAALSTVICLVLLVCCLVGWSLVAAERSKAALGVEDVLETMAAHGRLTRREAEVAALLIEGRSLPVIQEKLSISEGTVRTHAKHIYAKCGVRGKQELIDLYWEHVRGE